MKKICFLLQGCVNHLEEFRILLKNLNEEYELTKFPTQADLVIQYFCINTSKEISKIVKEMAFLKKVKREEAILIICGCAVEVLGKELFEQFPYVNYVIGRKNICENILKMLEKKKVTNDFFLEKEEQSISIEIIDGCTNKCTFCKVHYMDLPVKSKSIETILEIVTNLIKSGVVNIRLTGLNTTLYGIDLYGRPVLHILLKKLSNIKGLLNIDISELSTMNMYDELSFEIENNPIIGKVDIAFQSGSSHMLKIMNIHTTIEKMEKMIRSFGNKIGYTTFVIGHPYETKEDVDLTIDFIERNNLWYTQLSSYQDAPRLISHKMPQLSRDEYNYSVNKVIDFVSEFRKEKMNQLVNSRVKAFNESCIVYKDRIELHMIAEKFPCKIVINFEKNVENARMIGELEYLSKCEVTISGINNYDYLVLDGTDLEVCNENREK